MVLNPKILPKREFHKVPPRIVIPVSAFSFYQKLHSNLVSRGFQQTYQMFRDQKESINNLRTVVNIEYPWKTNEGSMDLIVEEPSVQDAIWRVRFKGTRLEDGTIPENPILLTIAHETMLGEHFSRYPADTIHPAVEGLDQTTINYFNTLQATYREYLLKR